MKCNECGQELPRKPIRRWKSEKLNLECFERDNGDFWVENGHWTLRRFDNGFLVVETGRLVLYDGEPDWELIEEIRPKELKYEDNIPF